MDEKLNRESHEPPPFGGKPGEPVPTVDPEDVKTVWQIMKDADARHPGKNVAVGIDLMRRACRPGTNIESVSYRAGFLWMMSYLAPEDRHGGRALERDCVVAEPVLVLHDHQVTVAVNDQRTGQQLSLKSCARASKVPKSTTANNRR